jgi:hypothetical protein
MKHDMPNGLNLLKKNYATEIKINGSRLPYFAEASSIENIMFIARENITILKNGDDGGDNQIFSKLLENLFKAEFKNAVALNSTVKIK